MTDFETPLLSGTRVQLNAVLQFAHEVQNQNPAHNAAPPYCSLYTVGTNCLWGLIFSLTFSWLMSRTSEGRTQVPLAKPMSTGSQQLREGGFSQKVKSTPHLPHPKAVLNPEE